MAHVVVLILSKYINEKVKTALSLYWSNVLQGVLSGYTYCLLFVLQQSGMK